MKTNVRWTEDELTVLKEFGGSKLTHELAELLPRHTAIGIRRKRAALGIMLSEEYLSRKGRHAWSMLDKDKLCKLDQSLKLENIEGNVLQVLLGSMLGDGCVKKNGSGKNLRNFIFYELHRRPQFEYTLWKANIFDGFLPTVCKSDSKNYCSFQTVSHPIFTMLRDGFYLVGCRNGKSQLPLCILKSVDYLGLMIWYLDDGYRGVPRGGKVNGVTKKLYPYITAKGYNLDDLLALVALLNKKLKLSLSVSTHKKKNRPGLDKRIKINAEDTRKLFLIWRKMAVELSLPDCMLYKLECEFTNKEQ